MACSFYPIRGKRNKSRGGKRVGKHQWMGRRGGGEAKKTKREGPIYLLSSLAAVGGEREKGRSRSKGGHRPTVENIFPNFLGRGGRDKKNSYRVNEKKKEINGGRS